MSMYLNSRNILPCGFCLQLFAADGGDAGGGGSDGGTGDGGGGSGSDDGGAGGAQDTFIYKGASGEYTLPAGFKDELNNRIAAEKRKITEDFTKKIQGISSSNAELEKSLKELQRSQMTEKERLEAEHLEKDQKLTETKALADRNWTLFKENRINTEIYTELGKYNLFNPAQVLTLVRGLGASDLVEADGDYKSIIKIGGQEISVADAVKQYLEDPQNGNLVRDGLRPGSGTQQRQAGGEGNYMNRSLEYKRSEINANPELEKEYRKRLFNQEPVMIVEN